MNLFYHSMDQKFEISKFLVHWIFNVYLYFFLFFVEKIILALGMLARDFTNIQETNIENTKTQNNNS